MSGTLCLTWVSNHVRVTIPMASIKKPERLKWNRQAELTLISLYESASKEIQNDHSFKNFKYWKSVAENINALGVLNVDIVAEQARGKFNTLYDKYKKAKDQIDETGQGFISCDHFDRLDDLFGDTTAGDNKITSDSLDLDLRKEVRALRGTEVQSDLLGSGSEDIFDLDNTPQWKKHSGKERKNVQASNENTPQARKVTPGDIFDLDNTFQWKKHSGKKRKNVQSSNENTSPAREVTPGDIFDLDNSPKLKRKHSGKERKNVRAQHGTGSGIAAKKLALEQKFMTYLNQVDQRNKEKVALKKEELEFKKQALQLKLHMLNKALEK